VLGPVLADRRPHRVEEVRQPRLGRVEGAAHLDLQRRELGQRAPAQRPLGLLQ
jgi:hypothetical protein